MEGSDIRFACPVFVAPSDEAFLAADKSLGRVVCIALTCAAEETAAVP